MFCSFKIRQRGQERRREDSVKLRVESVHGGVVRRTTTFFSFQLFDVLELLCHHLQFFDSNFNGDASSLASRFMERAISLLEQSPDVER